jgi:ABC-type transporter Mla subunit MlaD
VSCDRSTSQAGTKLVDAAGKTMEEIVASVRKVSDLVAEIAAASQEQSAGIGQVNTAVTQMDKVVQQNASLVEEAAAATESMKEQAASLLRMMEQFNLGSQRPQPAAVQAPPAAARPLADQPAASLRGAEILPERVIHAAPAPASGDWKEFQAGAARATDRVREPARPRATRRS